MNAIQLILAVALAEQQPTIFQERDDLPSNLFVPGDLLPVDAEAEATYTRWPVRHNHPSHAGGQVPQGRPRSETTIRQRTARSWSRPGADGYVTRAGGRSQAPAGQR